MRLREIKIENFRAFESETIGLENYTCLVGANGAGKSTVLSALNVFFRNLPSGANELTEEDFHKRNTSKPIRITLMFQDLSAEAQTDLKHYFRQGKLIVYSEATWNADTRSAELKQFGIRTVMEDFAKFFEAEDKGAKAEELKKIFKDYRSKFKEIAEAATKPAMMEALRAFEEAHPEHCKPLPSQAEFYGFSKGSNLLAKYVQWIYVPAVKDAASEQDEGTKTALGQLLDRTIRAKVSFEAQIEAMRKKLVTEYEQLVEKEKAVLTAVADSLQTRVRQWTNPGTKVDLVWHYDPDKSVEVREPLARVRLGEDGFLGEVIRLGHGMQRAFIVSILQELAETGTEKAPTLLLAVEEPELYQHPPQAQHMSNLLHELATREKGNTQVLITTHSPQFVSARGFESVRLVRKERATQHARVARATYADVEKRLAAALGTAPSSPTALMATVDHIMQPSQREMYFARRLVLVEGLEDVAFVASYLALSEKLGRFREYGCHFVVCGGKCNMSRPLAIARELGVPAFIIFDADGNEKKPDQIKDNKRDYSCLLNLLEIKPAAELPTKIAWEKNAVIWPNNIFHEVQESFGEKEWETAEEQVRKERGLSTVRRKNSILIAATVEHLYGQGKRSKTLDQLSDSILKWSSEA